MPQPELHAVILAGGGGTRFWPASRQERPKQFLAVTGERTMLAETRARIAGLVPLERTLVVCGAEHVDLVRESLPDLPARNVLAEPVGRNTLPAVALAALEIRRRAPESVQVVLPADHVIAPVESFHASVRQGAELAVRSGALVTFGVRPAYPATGYGYIEVGAETGELEGVDARDVLRFVEKPDEQRAREFLAGGRFLWNSGMFLWTTAAIAAAVERLVPEVYALLRDADPGRLEEVYPRLPSLPVDTAVMERAEARRVLPIDYTWSDVGSWAALPEVLAADGHGQYVAGGVEVVDHQARGCVVHGPPGELVALVGVEDLVVVRAGGATLVCPRARAQDVRAIVDELRRRDSPLL